MHVKRFPSRRSIGARRWLAFLYGSMSKSAGEGNPDCSAAG
ncbi:hypothetical protein [Azospirillum largimobile]